MYIARTSKADKLWIECSYTCKTHCRIQLNPFYLANAPGCNQLALKILSWLNEKLVREPHESQKCLNNYLSIYIYISIYIEARIISYWWFLWLNDLGYLCFGQVDSRISPEAPVPFVHCQIYMNVYIYHFRCWQSYTVAMLIIVFLVVQNILILRLYEELWAKMSALRKIVWPILWWWTQHRNNKFCCILLLIIAWKTGRYKVIVMFSFGSRI